MVGYPKSFDPLFSAQLLTFTPKKLAVTPKAFIDKDFATIHGYTSRDEVLIFVFGFFESLSPCFRLENLTIVLSFFCLTVAGDTILSSID